MTKNWLKKWTKFLKDWDFVYKKIIFFTFESLLETSSQELLADKEEPGEINVEIHHEQPTGDDKKIKHDEKPVFKKVIETENSIIEITRNF